MHFIHFSLAYVPAATKVRHTSRSLAVCTYKNVEDEKNLYKYLPSFPPAPGFGSSRFIIFGRNENTYFCYNIWQDCLQPCTIACVASTWRMAVGSSCMISEYKKIVDLSFSVAGPTVSVSFPSWIRLHLMISFGHFTVSCAAVVLPSRNSPKLTKKWIIERECQPKEKKRDTESELVNGAVKVNYYMM